MNTQLFLIILTTCSLVTSLFTEATKKLIHKKAATNIIVLILSIIIGGATTVIYYIFNDIPFDLKNSISIGLMVVANFLCTTVGYDKVMQTVEQIVEPKIDSIESEE